MSVDAMTSFVATPNQIVSKDGGYAHDEIVTAVECDDGVRLSTLIEGNLDAPMTVVLSHGCMLDRESWTFQRRALADRARVVSFDHRGHGRSECGTPESYSIDQLGRDLLAVVQQTASSGPVVLIGHSMGGMAILALADQHPELFGRSVVGAGLLATSAWPICPTFGLPGLAAGALRALAPHAVSTFSRWAGARMHRHMAKVFTRRFAVAPQAPAVLSDAITRTATAVRLDTLAALLPQFVRHNKSAALTTLRRVHTLIVAGHDDVIIPPVHAKAMAALVPEATLAILLGVGHTVTLERPDLLDRYLAGLLDAAAYAVAVTDGGTTAGVPGGQAEIGRSLREWRS